MQNQNQITSCTTRQTVRNWVSSTKAWNRVLKNHELQCMIRICQGKPKALNLLIDETKW